METINTYLGHLHIISMTDGSEWITVNLDDVYGNRFCGIARSQDRALAFALQNYAKALLSNNSPQTKES